MRESQVGKMNERITIETSTRTRTASGGYSTTYTPWITVWARIISISVRETLKSDQLIGEITHRVRIRYRDGINITCRISYKGKYFSIVGPPIDVQGRHRWLDLLCKEVQEVV